MAKSVTIKPEEAFARSYADQLILEKLSEMESAVKLGELADKLSGSGLGLGAVRSLLASNPERFAYFERRWIPASRLESQGRPFAEALELILDRFGGPMSFELLLQEVARVRQRTPEEIEAVLRRIVDSDPSFIILKDGKLALAKWAFLATDETVDRALELYNVDLEKMKALEGKLKNIDWRKQGAYSEALKVAAPAGVREISAVAWKALNSQDLRAILLFDGRKAFAELLATPGYVYASDGVLYTEDEAKKWLSTATKLADKLAPSIDIEDAAPIEIKPEDVAKMVKKIVASDSSITATRLLEENYEITPSNKTFPDDMTNLLAGLKDQPEIWWVGADRFRKANSAPDFVYTVPEPFQYVKTDFKDENGDLIDVELTDDGLSSSLRKLLSHPLAMDVLDEDIPPAPKTMPERLRLVLKSIHRELGTFPMAQIPTGWLDAAPDIQEFLFVDPSGRELQVWGNQQARLLYNLIDWWYEQPVESGAVFTLTKTTQPNVFEFEWDEQTDPVVYISTQRMEELRDLQAKSEEMSTLDLLIEVMGHWPKGADFLTVLAELNVVRRTTRRLVASLLSSYQCFYQRSGSPVWHFDAKKIDLGFDKTKKKFIKK